MFVKGVLYRQRLNRPGMPVFANDPFGSHVIVDHHPFFPGFFHFNQVGQHLVAAFHHQAVHFLGGPQARRRPGHIQRHFQVAP